MYQAADIDIQTADIDIITSYNARTLVHGIIQFSSINANRVDQPIFILFIAVKGIGNIAALLIEVILDFFRYSVAELITCYRIAADIYQSFAAGLGYRPVDGG